jgi:hypothetical protein
VGLLIIKTEAPSMDSLNYETSTATCSAKGGQILDRVCKHWDQKNELIDLSVTPIQGKNQCSAYSPPLWFIWRSPQGLNVCFQCGHKQGICVTSRNLQSPQAVNYSTTISSSKYKKKRNLYSESIPARENWPFYKRLQLAYLGISSAENQAQWPEHQANAWLP